ncbi:MAG TPA: 50S ribosomal protein L25/general stress protein Ctc [Spongiibacteraceae bacterium]|nr:50S ribosomal protein L25/general stress protein Ctc [Spongiibacteraceae bacterium]
MTATFTLTAKVRTEAGKGASRRLRRLAGELPGIVYGGEKAPQNISLIHKDLAKALEDEAFYSHIIKLTIDGNTEQVVLRDLQRHPSKPFILHADFQRIDATHTITMRVPLHFTNQDKCVGVRLGGGVISHSLSEVEVRCLPQNLPEFIEIDMAEIAVGTILHISDLKMPAGVESVELAHGTAHDLPVVSVTLPRGAAGEEAPAE